MEGDIINQLEEEGRAVVGGEEEEGGKVALVTSRAVCCPPELAAITRRPSIFLPDTLQVATDLTSEREGTL